MAFVSGAGGVLGGRPGVSSVCNRPRVRIACKVEGSEDVPTGPASRPAEVVEEKAVVEVAPEATVEASESEMCAGCGRLNCDGRIQGGIGAIPLFSWWPIKAYRPCPEYIKTKKYKRAGQNLAEIGGFGGKGFE
uniref:Uncharacterized protein n=1 Tax=Rhodosorus marinus TaxID=101924 RepID=A0A7S3A0B5_9RHOD|mmetsp:Transcript_37156/g.148236  ORF Transcript_37156/g.148236 Transcript_37156/m.148236 type:complete len:134 (+) Transcript_37156:222-623(+)|eukprot:CAMPEP_0113965270 /NCGR_PEP_ID=MMETSP0011_2-20120614/7649_1 /TAXON_ID=101924 /ORGANISM="Rhodosorus marinus" /LENGTH=133 /DNA_ID=CAMNT_0000977759 /DNA_START=146 /DNA_END=547 /DNA_ORIENTATION=+ /assembly_acc=CAM_ASM_000156